MKTSITATLVTLAVLSSGNALAAKRVSDGQLLSQCKAMVSTQFEDVKRIKLAQLKRNKQNFKAKLKVTTENDKGLFLCTISGAESPVIARLDVKGEQVASGN